MAGARNGVKIVGGAVFHGRCQNVGRRVSFEGLRLRGRRKEFAPCRRAQFLRGGAFLELELEGAFAWPVQHFV